MCTRLITKKYNGSLHTTRIILINIANNFTCFNIFSFEFYIIKDSGIPKHRGQVHPASKSSVQSLKTHRWSLCSSSLHRECHIGLARSRSQGHRGTTTFQQGVPTGSARECSEVLSLQNHFPIVHNIGDSHSSDSSPWEKGFNPLFTRRE